MLNKVAQHVENDSQWLQYESACLKTRRISPCIALKQGNKYFGKRKNNIQQRTSMWF